MVLLFVGDNLKPTPPLPAVGWTGGGGGALIVAGVDVWGGGALKVLGVPVRDGGGCAFTSIVLFSLVIKNGV
jgi:hypothetical protein